MAETEREAIVIRKRESRLPVRLTFGELEERKAALVEATKARELREQTLQAWKDSKKAEQKVMDADVMSVANECFRLAHVIEHGEEPRDVKVHDVLENTTVTTIRTDTGEVLAQRAATPEELQLPLR